MIYWLQFLTQFLKRLVKEDWILSKNEYSYVSEDFYTAL